ncbi:hypothetical protein [Lactobacillus sp. ESL0677]|nr:hypothetical protein [Lactobacillus sp. ESL0677]WEV36772.1 hypothetical protein OZX76_08545 [Lactobacillus sp. ESL0677]
MTNKNHYFYKQTGEIIGDLQKIGHIDQGVEFLQNLGDINLTFTKE